MNPTDSPLLDLPGDLEDTLTALGSALARPYTLECGMPDFKIYLLGGIDSGKTALARVLLNLEGLGIVGPAEKMGPDTTHPIEYRYGRSVSVDVLRPTGDALDSTGWECVLEQGPRPSPNSGVATASGAGSLSIDIERCLRIAAARGPFHRVRVHLPSVLLQRWDLRLIDLPSLPSDRPERDQAIIGMMREEPGIVLQLCSFRGVTEADLGLIETIYPPQSAVIANLRRTDLLPTRSVVQIQRAPSRRYSIDFVVPMVLTEIDRGLAQKVIVLLLEILRFQQLVDSLPELQKAVDAAKSRLAGEAAAELFGIEERIRQAGSSLAALEGLTDLRTLDDWLDAKALPVEKRIQGLAHKMSTEKGKTTSARVQILRNLSEDLIETYNIAAGKGEAEQRYDPDEQQTAFGRELIKVRSDLIGFLETLTSEPVAVQLGMGAAQSDSLQGLLQEVQDGRTEIATLGVFSSGKSAVINALLDVRNDDRNPRLLPTNVLPETATVNRLEWADTNQLLDVTWLETPRLTFIHEDKRMESGRYRVHGEEIAVFLDWQRRRVILEGEYVIDKIEVGHSKNLLVRQTPLECLLDAVVKRRGSGRSFETYVYKQGSRSNPSFTLSPVAASVQIKRFNRSPPDMHRGMSLDDAFQRMRDPSVALRTKMMHIGCDHRLLKHAAFIDTPGTDSIVPYHKKIAREVVHDRKCPVLYCFPANCAFGLEDDDNLRAILGKQGTSRRIFYVITCKGLIEREHERQQVHHRVRNRLVRLGIQDPKVYFVEVVKGPDPEFNELVDDLNRFVREQQDPKIKEWIRRAQEPIAEALRRATGLEESMDSDKTERATERTRLDKQAKALARIRAEFESSDDWGIPNMKGRLAAVKKEGKATIDSEMGALNSRGDFDGIEEQLQTEIQSLNRRARTTLNTVTAGATGKLRSLLASELAGQGDVRPPEHLEPDDAIYPVSDVKMACSSIEWPSMWTWWARRRKKWVTQYRDQIEGACTTALGVGSDNIDTELDDFIKKVNSHLDVLEERLASDILATTINESPAERERIQGMRNAAESWNERFENLMSAYRKLVVRRNVS